MRELKNQICPVCNAKKLILIEEEREIPYFGKCYLMSMTCQECKYHKSDVESVENKGPIKYVFIVKNTEDLKVRVIKGAEATIKLPQLRMSVESGNGGIGYISNVEGVLRRFKKIVEDERDNAEDANVKKTAKNLLKKFWKVECGDMELKIVIEDKTGNSAIVSDKAEVSKLK
ncbi:MAG: ZPR1 zinc finger domain-containing protein [Nanoarchaeota archaeon]|nr:ZPR1 zinc finger domain-containing protein [Nanoarchaeota archaeon]